MFHVLLFLGWTLNILSNYLPLGNFLWNHKKQSKWPNIDPNSQSLGLPNIYAPHGARALPKLSISALFSSCARPIVRMSQINVPFHPRQPITEYMRGISYTNCTTICSANTERARPNAMQTRKHRAQGHSHSHTHTISTYPATVRARQRSDVIYIDFVLYVGWPPSR